MKSKVEKLLFEKINKIDKTLVKLTKKEKRHRFSLSGMEKRIL